MVCKPDAVILGGGPAGLLAAAALDRHGFAVIVVDQDDLDDLDGSYITRVGVPHAEQLHNLLGRGQHHFDELLPGYTDALIAAGGSIADVASETHVYELGIQMPERSLQLRLISAPRRLIESVARALLPLTVKRRWATRVTGLRLSSGRVTGVDTSAGPIDAALVVDALGANSPVSRWYGRPPAETTFAVRQWYTTAAFRRPKAQSGAPDFWLTFPHTGTRSGLISPRGQDCWSASVSGLASDRAPRDSRQFLDFARSLEDHRIATSLANATPLDRPRTFARPLARWRRFDESLGPTQGIVHLGDAVACLNPLLGQGLSVAAWQASRLGVAASRGLEYVDHEFPAAAAAAASDAWDLTRIYESTLTAEDWNQVARRVTDEREAHRQYVRMWHLLEPPTTASTLAHVGAAE